MAEGLDPGNAEREHVGIAEVGPPGRPANAAELENRPQKVM